MSYSSSGQTFTQAYMNSRQTGSGGLGYSRARRNEATVTNLSELDAILQKVVGDIEQDSKTSVKNVLKLIPPHFAKHVTAWQDSQNLDIIHHMIINNRPELLSFIISETSYFPYGYVPMVTPYAHLAAVLGYADCLRIILQYRPSTFFKTDQPSHVIKLPEHIMKKVRLNNSAKTATKQAGKIMGKIKSSGLGEEQELKNPKGTDHNDSDITSVLDEELDAVEKSFAQTKKSLPKSVQLKDRRKHLYKERKPDADDALLKRNAQDPDNDPDSIPKHFDRRLKPGANKHLITVFWDVLSELDPGVVKGAGQPVKVTLAPIANRPRPHIDLDRTTFVNTQTQVNSSTGQPGANTTKSQMASMLTQSHSSVFSPTGKAIKTIDFGVRGAKKYKDFQIKARPSIPPKPEEDEKKYMNKTPLTLAAEHGNSECVQLILDLVVMRRHPNIATKEPLTLATKARSPEAIMLLLEKRTSRNDYQSAVMLSIREMYPDCLTALLTNKSKDRWTLFDGTNLYHILYSQCVISCKRYALMPEMTRSLIDSKEDVNAHGCPRTYPMYTLINCAFNITVGKQIFFFIDCLHILLARKANPHFDEEKHAMNSSKKGTFNRQPFRSAINCVFESAKNSTNFLESSYWPKLFMKKFITTIEMFDLTPRRVLNNVFFDYMDAVCLLGLDKAIVRCLLRYGGNPDFMKEGKYPVNMYFDKLLPYLTRFEVLGTYERYRQELTELMFICRHMSFPCLSEALVIFLTDHLLTAPIQALRISREFASLMDQLVRTPRTLTELAAHTIWLRTKRNKNRVKQLPIPEAFFPLIIP